MIWTILTAYATISVSFSLGMVAGAWWASRARIHEPAGLEMAELDWNDDDQSVVRTPPAAVFYCLGQRV